LGGIVFSVVLFGIKAYRCLRVSIAVDRKSTGHTIGELSWNKLFFCVFSVAVIAKCFEAFG
jgi:hypothetical protein